MIFRSLADLTAVAHLLFVVFVVAGGLLVLRRPRWAWVHAPAAVWGVFIEWSGGVCPLTPLENWLRRRAGEVGYEGGFIEHYVLPMLYPENLTRSVQVALGGLALAINLAVYAMLVRSWARQRGEAGQSETKRDREIGDV